MANLKLAKFLKELKDKFGSLPTDLHITRKAGAFVAISNGKIIKIGEPSIKYCPLFKMIFDKNIIDKDSIAEKFDWQIKNLGMFTCHRELTSDKIIVPFGASEILMYALRRKEIDCAVVVCEGAGTVISNNPSLIQGIGAYMNGVFYTSPVREVINKIEKEGGIVLDTKNAKINQFLGIKKALRLGYKKIAVTLRGDETVILKKIKSLEKINNIENIGYKEQKELFQKQPGLIEQINQINKTQRIKITVLSVCNSGITKKQAEVIKDNADLIWACGSKFVREIVGPSAVIQLGVKIPVFVMNKKGLDLISSYSHDDKLINAVFGINDNVVDSVKQNSIEERGNYKSVKTIKIDAQKNKTESNYIKQHKQHYITSNKFKPGGIKLGMGKFYVYLYPADNLPIITEDEPTPLI